MRRDREHFGDRELTLIFIARKLKEALRLEAMFTDAGLDYFVEPDTYRGGFLFRHTHVGAFFYVAPEDDEAACEVLERRGLRPYGGD
jgi:hypothetical protein